MMEVVMDVREKKGKGETITQSTDSLATNCLLVRSTSRVRFNPAAA